MSPKSRGRPPGRGRPKQAKPAVVPMRLSDRVLREARSLEPTESAVLEAERWASGALGRVWLDAPIGDREPEHMLCMEVVGRACSRPSPHGLAAVAALNRVAPAGDERLLGQTLALLGETQPRPAWEGAGSWTPTRAWRAVDVWESERVLFVEYDGPHPHTLMAAIGDVGGRVVDTLALLRPNAAALWSDARSADDVPMPVSGRPVDGVLAELADAMRQTDMIWPRQDDDGYVELRALAWSRCRALLPGWPDFEPIGDDERQRLIDDFVAESGLPNDTVTRSLADLFVDYGDGYIGARPLGWSPGWVGVFLSDWLPRKVALDAEQRSGLPEALRRWITFALHRRGVEPRWVEPVVAAVDEYLPAFEEAFDDTSAWGSAKQLVAELTARGIDLDDRDAVDTAIRQVNAERLARRLTEG